MQAIFRDRCLCILSSSPWFCCCCCCSSSCPSIFPQYTRARARARTHTIFSMMLSSTKESTANPKPIRLYRIAARIKDATKTRRKKKRKKENFHLQSSTTWLTTNFEEYHDSAGVGVRVSTDFGGLVCSCDARSQSTTNSCFCM
jgi:hypothetical protein